MSITDKPSSLRWIIVVNLVTITIFYLLFSFIRGFFPDELFFVSFALLLVGYLVILQYIFDIWGDKIFTDPKYWIKKEDMDNFLKQKVIQINEK